MTQTTTTRARVNRKPYILIGVGIIAAIVGWRIMAVAAARKAYAQDVSDYTIALGGLPDGAVASAVALGHLGLGVLIVGLVVAVVGGVLAVARR